jgi:NADPH-dependent curcumin reductase CurA
MSLQAHTLVLAERPKDDIVVGKTFEKRTAPLPSPSELKDGEVLVEVLYLSLDPAMRGWLNDVRSYLPPVQIGEKMRGVGVCRVLASRSKTAAEKDLVVGNCGWADYAVLAPGTFEVAPAGSAARPQDLLSATGMTGMTAWVGIQLIAGEIKPGQTVVVSGAAGATGSIAAQIAKHVHGARVVAIAGGEEKCRWLTEELGLDVALDYKAPDFKAKLKEATKDFIDVYFDNVGGEVLDLCLGQAKQGARFVSCGMISQYNLASPTPLKNISRIVTMRIRMEGFIVLDHREKFPQARKELSEWIADGKVKTAETILKGGIQAAERGLVDLYKGINKGKLLVEVKNPEEASPKL